MQKCTLKIRQIVICDWNLNGNSQLPFHFFFLFCKPLTTYHNYLRIKCFLKFFLNLGKLIFFSSFGTSDHIRGPRTDSDLRANLLLVLIIQQLSCKLFLVS